MDLSIMKPVHSIEIKSLLTIASEFGGRVTQPNQKDSHCYLITGFKVSEDGQITINLDNSLHIREDRTICIDLNYRDVFFRLRPGEFSLRGCTLFGTLPLQLHALKKREDERFIIKEKFISCFNRIEKRASSNSFEAAILDISKRGLGLHIKDLPEGSLQLNDHLWIRSIAGSVLDKAIFGRIIYLAGFKYSSSSNVRLGITLDSHIPEALMMHLTTLK